MARGKGGSGSKTANLCALGSNGCRKPTGNIDWLRCDGCHLWYHCTCVKVNPNDAVEMIYHCKACKPQKEEEYYEIKDRLKEGLSKIVKAHPNFATGPIARKCFATKGKSDEYHAESKGVPLTLMELSLKIEGVFQSTDHFADASQRMTTRMKEFLKTEHNDEVSRIGKEIEKLIVECKNKRKTPNGKKMSIQEEAESSEEEKPTSLKRKSPVKKQPDSAKKIKTAPKKEQKSSFEKEEALRALKAPSEQDIKVHLKCENCKTALALPIFQCPESHQVCGQCSEKADKGYCPICKTTSNRNRRMKKLNKWPEKNANVAPGPKSEMLPAVGTQIPKMDNSMISATVKPPEKVTMAPTPPVAAAQQRPGAGPRRPAMLVPRTGPAAKNPPFAQSKVTQIAQPTTLEVLKLVQTAAKSDANLVPQAKGRANRKRRGKSDDLDNETSPPEEKISRQKVAGQKVPELPSATIPDNIMDDGEDLGKPVKLSDLTEMEPIFAACSSPTAIPKTATMLLSPNQIRASTPLKSQQPMVLTVQPQVIPIQPQARPTLAGALHRSPVPTIITSQIPSTSPRFFKIVQGNSLMQIPNALDSAQRAARPILSPTKNIRGSASFLTPGVPTRPQVIFPHKEVRMTAPVGQQPRSIIRPAPPRAIAPNQGPVLLRTVGSAVPTKSPQLPVVPLPRTSLTNAQSTQLKSSAAPTISMTAPVSGLKPAENSLTKAFVWKSSDRTQFKLSARFNFDLFREYQSKHPQKDVRFALATIVTEDRVNEFSFHLTQKKDSPLEDKPWQLGVRSKNPSDHIWHLKVKVDPPIFLVNNQKFEQATKNFEIPKKVSDKAVVDYELLLMGKAAASGFSSASKTLDANAETTKAQPSPKKAS